MIEKSYKKRLTAWGTEATSHEIDYDPEELKRQVASGLKLHKIAGNFGVCNTTLAKWRKAHGCPTKAPKKPITPELFQVFDELYKQGYTDTKIAHETAHGDMTVRKWRESKGYPPHKKPARELFERMYSEGCRNYSTLSKATGLSTRTMRIWMDEEIKEEASKAENPEAYYKQARERLKDLNSNSVNHGALKKQITLELLQVFEELYKQGYTDARIADETIHSQYTVMLWRTSKGYPKNKKPARITFEKMYGEGCRNYITLSEATGLSEATMRVWVYREIRKEAKKSENPKAYYRWTRERLKDLNSKRMNQRLPSNRVNQRLPRYRTCTIKLL